MIQTPKHKIYTVGHSTRPIKEFIDLLRHYGITRLIDVRTVPRSRHNPQYSREKLAPKLRACGIKYRHMKSLGGLRKPLNNSKNTWWINPSFRGFADYMLTPEFERGLDRLIELSSDQHTVIMCAEAVPWRCHRSLIGDALSTRKIQVIDIMSKSVAKIHKKNPHARIRQGKITYPPTEVS